MPPQLCAHMCLCDVVISGVDGGTNFLLKIKAKESRLL